FPPDTDRPGHLAVSESSEVEFKSSFQWKSKSKYAKTIAGMANNTGGYLLFGVDDTARVVGIDETFWDSVDPCQLSQRIGQFAPAVDVSKGKVIISGSLVGVVHVKESVEKPVTCQVTDAVLESGAIYFRYTGETRAIKAPELLALLRERDRRTEERMAAVVHRLQKVGTGQAAVLDLQTGRVDGQMGHFLLPAELLSQVRVVQEGRLVEVDGAPALRLVGDLEVVGGGASRMVTIRKVNLSDEDVIEDFLHQREVQNPEDYLRYLGHSGALWLPAYYYARRANLGDSEAADLVADGSKGKRKQAEKQADRIRNHQQPKMSTNLSRDSFAEIRAALAAGEDIALGDDKSVQSFLKAAFTIGPGEAELPQLLGPLRRIFEEHYHALDAYPLQLFRNAVVRADLLFFTEPQSE
ncbi:MAG: ATP-binding protein, partial [Alphaproteobacteria bacterium]|nr:ATP-binding protein [Alphaproteobacteria bacterium]